VDLLDQAILTLSAAFLGKIAGDVRLQKLCLVMYGYAVNDLCKAMSVVNFCPNDAVLAAIMCLGMSEVSGICVLGPAVIWLKGEGLGKD
jgi:hypothetical protein